MRIARSKSLPMPWTRVGVRLIPNGHSANRSLSAIEPVSATAKRKLENGEQRPVPEIYPARAEIPKITGQSLGSASVTRGNVAGSHTPGNITPETRLPGWVRPAAGPSRRPSSPCSDSPRGQLSRRQCGLRPRRSGVSPVAQNGLEEDSWAPLIWPRRGVERR
jgi:hypothetical protein